MKSFICLWFLLSVMDQSVCGDPVNITAEPGQDVTLPCRAAGNGIVTVLRLTRDDLQPDSVLLYRNEQIDEEQQNPQYKNRAKLQNLISTDGEINLTLDNVTEKDSGEYECRVRTEIKSNRRRKRAASESTFIHLSVAPLPPAPPGNQDGGNTDGLGVGRSHAVLVAVLVFAAVSVFVSMVMMTVIRRKKIKTPSPPDDAEKPQLI